jgi:phage terminase large subunit-like protein
MAAFHLNAGQQRAQLMLVGPATHQMLYGGSRSGKTFLHCRNIVARGLKAPKSRHAILRFRFNAAKESVALDTFPTMMEKVFPGVDYDINKSDWFARLSNDTEIWFGGLDDKERVAKILGKEYATILLNEASQISWQARNVALTRLAQKAMQVIDGKETTPLKLRMLYDENPPPKSHWTYKVFHDKTDPETKEGLPNVDDYAWCQINPDENTENQGDGYLATLKAMSGRMQKRFLKGEFADATPNALFSDEVVDKWRVTDGKTPDLVRVVVGVDPSGSGDVDNADNDAIGIVAVGLGTDGNAYVLEDATVKAGPATWGSVAVSAYSRHAADVVVGEVNYGGAMVQQTIEVAARAKGIRNVQFKPVTATRGKVVRAEPFSALYEEGKIRHVGAFPELEDELSAFSTYGYTGSGSPNRADALIWALSELFPGLFRKRASEEETKPERYSNRKAGRDSAWTA